ncbi:MAG: restriction endonuclease subunit S [Saprospiraceae bacterium]|nr:restriction endonuclease subunit S [Saprospiraceae bacterium]
MKVEKLGNIADIIAGQSPPSSTYNSEGKGIPFFQGKADYGEKYPSVRYWCTEPTKISLPDDILISMRAPVGPVNINIVESCIGRGLSAIRVKKNVSRDFIYFWLKQNQHLIAAKETGSTFKAITQKILNEIVVPFPSYPDQLHIANLLSKAENLIAQRKESIHLLDEFLKSTFLEMFGNTRYFTKSEVVKTIGEICSTRGGGTPSKAKPEYYTGEIPWVSPKDMKWLYITTSQDKITQQAVDESSTVLIPKDSLLMVIRSGILKSKLPIAINKVAVTINQDMKAFSSKEVTTEYLLYYFFSEERNILKKVKGTTADNLNFDDIKKMKIKVPPLELQTQFAQIVEKTEAIKTQYQRSLQELENLYGSLSQKAFKGKLTINKTVSVLSI